MKNGDYILVIAPSDYPGKIYRNKYCYEHHLVYWQNYHVVPSENEVIHHIDGNKQNNNIDNLQLTSREKHSAHHGENKTRKMVLLRCPTCEKLFQLEKRQSFLQKNSIASYCSRECANKANLLRARKDERFLFNLTRNLVKEFSA